ncbi:DnaD domain protein [Streptococcus acidominimus]|uniref:DnaD domain protein n=1 Tax=Streptococcus acidominimus TaxID=1326 RepID=A0A4Y9FMP5_STRAI|nr:DnaD domain protein [Streptococcus acidominimus]MBF0818972.1 replication initiator protein A [Streptococcus acidominimus]MBF0837897.1 replication initiator protein A [Streptococcus acidominimus]MBF0846076.1 replication initiator protein A [Streptococcus danieliae]TFU30484.1 DnaD domain protein [Streptococcus acidominimus]
MLILTNEIKQAMKFFKMPKILFESEQYKTLSVKAKAMYMLLFDRLDLSVKNGWTDEYGYTYQFYKIEQFMIDLNCSNKTVISIKKELSDKGLLKEVSQGANKPNKIYLGVPNESTDVKKLHNGRVETTRRECKNYTSGGEEITQQDVKKLHGNKTEVSRLSNNTNISTTAYQEEVAAAVAKNPIGQKLKEAFGEMSISGTIVQEVEDLLATHGQTLVLHALDETILNAGKSIRYTRRILENWQGLGLRTVEQVEQNQRNYATKRKLDKTPFQEIQPDPWAEF